MADTEQLPIPTTAARGTWAAAFWARIRPTQPALPWHAILAAAVAGGVTIALLGEAGNLAGTPILIAAFGSSCVLIFLVPDGPLSRPLNVVGGHFLAALCGLIVQTFLPVTWWSLGLAVGLAMAAMATARVIHPPAGGTPIALMLGGEGWDYLFTPVLAGALALSACALIYRFFLARFSRANRAPADVAKDPAADVLAN